MIIREFLGLIVCNTLNQKDSQEDGFMEDGKISHHLKENRFKRLRMQCWRKKELILINSKSLDHEVLRKQ